MRGVLQRGRRRLRRASCVVAVALAGAALGSAAARAQNATWKAIPENGDFNNQFNWNPNAVPTGIASFGTSTITTLTFSTNTMVGGLTLNPGASNYTFVNFNFNQTLNFNGAGIVANGGSATIVNNTDGAVVSFSNSSTAGSAAIFNGAALNNFPSLLFLNTSTAGSASITNSIGSTLFENSSTAGSATLTNTGNNGGSNFGIIEFENNSTAGRATIINNNTTCGVACSIDFFNASTAANAAITNNAGGFFSFSDSSTAGNATITNNGTLQFFGASAAGNASITSNSNSIIQFLNNSTAGSAIIVNNSGSCNTCQIDFFNASTAGNATITNNNSSSIFFGDGSTAGSATITNNKNSSIRFADTSTAGSATITNNNSSIFFQNNSTAGSAAIANNAGGVVDFSLTSGPAGNHQLSAGSIAGAGNFYLGANALTVGGNNLSTAVGGVISDCGTVVASCATPGVTGGSLVKVGTGTLKLSGADTYTGATTVNGGTLEVDGSIARSSLTTVNFNGTLTGIGTVGSTQINSGGQLTPGAAGVPGTSMTIAGKLTFQPGGFYGVFLNSNTSSFSNVTGAASLAGQVNAVFTGGFTRQYTILQSAGLGGTTFSGLANANLPVGFFESLRYSADDVFLNLTAGLGASTPLNQNQQNVASTINNFFNAGGTLPPAFVNLFNLTGANLANTLTRINGEPATAAQLAGIKLMTGFLEVMSPFGSLFGGAGGAIGFAPEKEASFPPDIARAYDAVLKAPPQQTFAPRWTTWAAGFGGSATTSGDPAVGSNTVSTRIYGYAAGTDYHYSPDTVFGFALAGGSTGWNLAQGLGTGGSDAFLGGIRGVTRQGPAYLAGALAFADSWFTTNRTALGDQLTASFQGQSYAARLEGGYRFAVPVAHNLLGVTPYAAIQVQNFHTPAYSEIDLTAGGLGLSYAAMNGTDTRSELGGRFDDLTAFRGMPLILRAQVAWAHDWVSNPALNASFESLPGTSFTVFGAPIPHDSALASAGAELIVTSHLSVLAKFDGEFAAGSQTYAGTGTVRYTW
jgi:autotransporter-associated beta strand protein